MHYVLVSVCYSWLGLLACYCGTYWTKLALNHMRILLELPTSVVTAFKLLPAR